MRLKVKLLLIVVSYGVLLQLLVQILIIKNVTRIKQLSEMSGQMILFDMHFQSKLCPRQKRGWVI